MHARVEQSTPSKIRILAQTKQSRMHTVAQSMSRAKKTNACKDRAEHSKQNTRACADQAVTHARSGTVGEPCKKNEYMQGPGRAPQAKHTCLRRPSSYTCTQWHSW
eukprot:1153895-Pelagomonas_calceolata.AAC.3